MRYEYKQSAMSLSGEVSTVAGMVKRGEEVVMTKIPDQQTCRKFIDLVESQFKKVNDDDNITLASTAGYYVLDGHVAVFWLHKYGRTW